MSFQSRAQTPGMFNKGFKHSNLHCPTSASSTSRPAGANITTPPEYKSRGESAEASQISITTAEPADSERCSPFSSVSSPFSMSVATPALSASWPTMGPSKWTQQLSEPRGNGRDSIASGQGLTHIAQTVIRCYFTPRLC